MTNIENFELSCKGPFIYDVHTEEWWGLEICHVFANFMVFPILWFKQYIYCSFLRIKGVRVVTKVVIFMDAINV